MPLSEPDRPDVVIKPMFGNLGAFVKGNMFAGRPRRSSQALPRRILGIVLAE